MKFLQELNQFTQKLIEDWKSDTGKMVGISIQKLDDLQDENSITRDTHAAYENVTNSSSFINHYCYHILLENSNIVNCNKLDFFMKQYANINSIDKVICKCHGGISNILIKLTHNEIDWYIFIGQFLLKMPIENYKDFFLKEFNINEFKKSQLPRYGSQSPELIKEGGFVNENYFEDLKLKVIEKKGGGELSLFSIQEYTFLEKYVLANFKRFIDGYFLNSQPNQILREYIDYIDIDSIKFHLDICIKEASSLSPSDRNKSIRQLNVILSKIKTNDQIEKSLLLKLKTLSREYTNASIGTPTFFESAQFIIDRLG